MLLILFPVRTSVSRLGMLASKFFDILDGRRRS